MNPPAHYEVELYTQFGEFEYMVDAYTGEVLGGPSGVLESSGTTTTTPSTGRPSSASGISAEAAKSAALAAAGLTESQVSALTSRGTTTTGGWNTTSRSGTTVQSMSSKSTAPAVPC